MLLDGFLHNSLQQPSNHGLVFRVSCGLPMLSTPPTLSSISAPKLEIRDLQQERIRKALRSSNKCQQIHSSFEPKQRNSDPLSQIWSKHSTRFGLPRFESWPLEATVAHVLTAITRCLGSTQLYGGFVAKTQT